jgi:hypothetical protein
MAVAIYVVGKKALLTAHELKSAVHFSVIFQT